MEGQNLNLTPIRPSRAVIIDSTQSILDASMTWYFASLDGGDPAGQAPRTSPNSTRLTRLLQDMRDDAVSSRTSTYGTDPCALRRCSDHARDPSLPWHLNHHLVWLYLSMVPISFNPIVETVEWGSSDVQHDLLQSSIWLYAQSWVFNSMFCSLALHATTPIFLWSTLGSSVDLRAVAVH
ncbi:hypothetical protein BDV93DRAFT_256886 [Ceratobasidium sp. AG-I]|nr:hypothetical protein BDV93DRAFT_256886 [Ceratobasidium sp. AG-I]